MTVTIVRDVDGVAHVRADDLDGAFFGQGYAAAQDRLWQMEYDRRKALGRLAEVLGAAALASDRYHRRLGIGSNAEATATELGPAAQAMLRAYSDGVNAYLATGPDLPPEFAVTGTPAPDPWAPWHSVAVHHVRHLWMGTADVKLWRSGLLATLGPEAVARLWPAVAEVLVHPDASERTSTRELIPVLARLGAAVAALPDLHESGGSNNLAVAGPRTATGHPIVGGDPHRAIDLPNVYWPNHLTWNDPDGGGDVIGLSFPGIPGFPHFGHNRDVAWCITHGMADDQDLYVEHLRLDPDGRVEWRSGGEWRPATTTTETITVAGGPDETVGCIATGNGPVIAGSAELGVALALRWTASAARDTTFDCLVPQMRAGGVDDLDTAFVPWVVPANNVIAADRSGAIAYRFRGRLAIRPEANGWAAVDGSDPATAWAGFVVDADLPRFRDPGRGFLVTANNRVTEGGPYVSNDWAHPARSRRLTARLAERSDWTVEAIGDLLGDTHSAVAAAFARRLAAVDATLPVERAAQGLLRSWDHHMDAGSAAAAVYGVARAELLRLVTHDLGLHDAVVVAGVGYTPAQTMRALHIRLAFLIDDHDIVSDAMVRSALRWAVQHLTSVSGSDPSRWRWGDLHRAGFHHAVGALRPDLADSLPRPPAVELGGDNECVRATGTSPPSLAAVTGPVARYVFDVSDWDNSVWVLPHGVSGDPRSPHWADQVDDWAGVRYRPMRWSPSVIDAATESTTDLRRP